jgi:hypothetical protein
LKRPLLWTKILQEATTVQTKVQTGITHAKVSNNRTKTKLLSELSEKSGD